MSIIALLFLAPILNMAHQDLHTHFISTVSLFNAGLAAPAFITWQVVVSLLFTLTIICCYLSLRNEKYQLIMYWLLIGIMPIAFTYVALLLIA